MLNKSVIAVLLFTGIILVSISTIGKFDSSMQLVALNHLRVLP